MSISTSPFISRPLLERRLLPERLARTVCEIDPSPGGPFAVAVVLEVLGYSDRRAKEAGWADVFALAREVFGRIEFLGTAGAARSQSRKTQPARPDASSPVMAVIAQQAVWLVMVALMIAWGRSVWSADNAPFALAQALTVGILGSLIVSGGFQYAITRRLLFHTAQRDFTQAQAFFHRAVWAGGGVMSIGALAVTAGIWKMHPYDHLAPLVAAGYFVLHGNYRVAVVPLIALNDVAGLVLTTGIGVGLLALTYARLVHAGTDAAQAIILAQLVGLTALWLGSLARSRSLLGGVRVGVVAGADLPVSRGSHGLGRTRWLVVWLDAAPWFATGVLYYLFLFATRPIAWMLSPAERQVFESGVDLGILGIVPVAIAASWGLHRYYQGLREQMMRTEILGVTELRTRAVTRFSQMLWRCRWFGAAAAIVLLAATGGAPWGGMDAPTFLVFRITVVGLIVALPGFLFSFGMLTGLGALRDAGGVLVCGLILQCGEGLLMVQRGTAGWLALALIGAATTLSELAIWRANRLVRNIDRYYYAAF
ncbi:MAG TPA: hypothetical protein VFP86_02255 [bacterium]|nr:hypothetical protein [bacterium]